MGIAGDWRELNSEELHDFCFSPCVIRVSGRRHRRWVDHVACRDRSRNVCLVLVGRCKKIRMVGRPVKRDIKSTRMGQYGLDLSGSG